MGISCSPVQPLQFTGAASQEQTSGQPRQQPRPDPDTSEGGICMAETDPMECFFATCSVLWVYPRAADARTKAIGLMGVEGASLGIHV